MRIRFDNKNPSDSLNLLISVLKERGINAAKLKKVNSKFRCRYDDHVFKWGYGHNKITQYMKFAANDVPSMEFTTDAEEAIERFGFPFLCRSATGFGGRGISVADTADQVVQADMYVKYQKKTREFRVHYSCGSMLIFEKKMMARERRPEGFDARIRNHDNGWVFCNYEGIDEERVEIQELAQKAVDCVGYDFAGVDIGFHPSRGLFVFEVNSQPGCNENTVQWYADSILNYIGAH